jgi:aspartate aminotransferase
MTQPTLSPERRTNLRLSSRFDAVGFSEIVRIRNRVMELKAAGRTIFQFEGGEPFFETPEHIKAAMRDALAENKTRYAPLSGIGPLVDLLAEKLTTRNRIPCAKDDIVVGVGGMQGLYGAFNSLLDPGDEVMLFSPYWTPTVDLIQMSAGVPVTVDTNAAFATGITAALEAKLTPRTRALLLNTPNNPTGTVFNRAQLEEVAAFAKKNDVVVVADEAYEDLVYEGEHVSIASLPGMYERTITTFTLSKSYGMTGWRVGYAVAAEPFATGLKKSVLYSTNGVSTPSQWAAVAALKTSTDFFAECLAEYRQRRDLLVSGLNALGLTVDPVPNGAFYVFPSIKAFGKSSSEMAMELLDKANVATIPGTAFGAEGAGHLRMSYSLPVETIEKGLAALGAYLNR